MEARPATARPAASERSALSESGCANPGTTAAFYLHECSARFSCAGCHQALSSVTFPIARKPRSSPVICLVTCGVGLRATLWNVGCLCPGPAANTL